MIQPSPLLCKKNRDCLQQGRPPYNLALVSVEARVSTFIFSSATSPSCQVFRFQFPPRQVSNRDGFQIPIFFFRDKTVVPIPCFISFSLIEPSGVINAFRPASWIYTQPATGRLSSPCSRNRVEHYRRDREPVGHCPS